MRVLASNLSQTICIIVLMAGQIGKLVLPIYSYQWSSEGEILGGGGGGAKKKSEESV